MIEVDRSGHLRRRSEPAAICGALLEGDVAEADGADWWKFCVPCRRKCYSFTADPDEVEFFIKVVRRFDS